MKDLGQNVRQACLFHPALLVLVSTAALLRLALSLYFPRVIKDDEPIYLLLGHDLLAGNGFTYTDLPASLSATSSSFGRSIFFDDRRHGDGEQH